MKRRHRAQRVPSIVLVDMVTVSESSFGTRVIEATCRSSQSSESETVSIRFEWIAWKMGFLFEERLVKYTKKNIFFNVYTKLFIVSKTRL